MKVGDQFVNPIPSCTEPEVSVIRAGSWPSTEEDVGKPTTNKGNHLRLAGLAVVFVLLYAPTLGSLIKLWWTRDDYSHGFLVPIVSLYLVFLRREALRHLSLLPALHSGLAMMSLGALLLVIGEAGAMLILSQTSVLVMIVGLMLTLGGSEFLRILRLPVAYLFFMLPLLEPVLLWLQWPLQLVTARMAVLILQTLSIPAQLDQNYIGLPNIVLRVAPSCSGARYLVSILAVSILVAYLTLRRRRSRVTLVALAMVIGVVANWARVVFIGLWAYSGWQVVHGPFHVFQALSVAWVSYAGIFLVAWVLRTKNEGLTPIPTKMGSGTGSLVGRDLVPSDWASAWRASLVILLASLLLVTSYRGRPTLLRMDFSKFPARIGTWVEQTQERPNTIFHANGADRETHKLYRREGGLSLCLYIAYYEQQTHDKEVNDDFIIELIESAEAKVTRLGSEVGAPVPVNHAIFGDGSQIIYWYDLSGQTATTRMGAKVHTTWSALTRRRTNGALMMIYCEREQPLNQDSDTEQMRSFMVELLPLLRNYLP